jgi:hypothetical protein
MATANSTNQRTFEPYDRQDFSVIEPFIPARHFERIAKLSLDLAGGLAVILELLERNSIDKENGTEPLLGEHTEGQLFRMAATTAHLLTEEACGAISLVEKNHRIARP